MRDFGNASEKRDLNITINCGKKCALATKLSTTTRFVREKLLSTRLLIVILTAMSGLSERTYSCGGLGSLLTRGGEAALTLAVSEAGGAFEKNFKMPSFLVN